MQMSNWALPQLYHKWNQQNIEGFFHSKISQNVQTFVLKITRLQTSASMTL